MPSTKFQVNFPQESFKQTNVLFVIWHDKTKREGGNWNCLLSVNKNLLAYRLILWDFMEKCCGFGDGNKLTWGIHFFLFPLFILFIALYNSPSFLLVSSFLLFDSLHFFFFVLSFASFKYCVNTISWWLVRGQRFAFEFRKQLLRKGLPASFNTL